jgi:hypothetical protein
LSRSDLQDIHAQLAGGTGQAEAAPLSVTPSPLGHSGDRVLDGRLQIVGDLLHQRSAQLRSLDTSLAAVEQVRVRAVQGPQPRQQHSAQRRGNNHFQQRERRSTAFAGGPKSTCSFHHSSNHPVADPPGSHTAAPPDSDDEPENGEEDVRALDGGIVHPAEQRETFAPASGSVIRLFGRDGHPYGRDQIVLIQRLDLD